MLEGNRKYFKMQKQADVESVSSPATHIEHFLVPGTSYVLWVSLLSAAVSVGGVALAILGGYSCIWYGWHTQYKLCLFTLQRKWISCLILIQSFIAWTQGLCCSKDSVVVEIKYVWSHDSEIADPKGRHYLRYIKILFLQKCLCLLAVVVDQIKDKKKKITYSM